MRELRRIGIDLPRRGLLEHRGPLGAPLLRLRPALVVAQDLLHFGDALLDRAAVGLGRVADAARQRREAGLVAGLVAEEDPRADEGAGRFVEIDVFVAAGGVVHAQREAVGGLEPGVVFVALAPDLDRPAAGDRDTEPFRERRGGGGDGQGKAGRERGERTEPLECFHVWILEFDRDPWHVRAGIMEKYSEIPMGGQCVKTQ